jgi:hypothetical protein
MYRKDSMIFKTDTLSPAATAALQIIRTIRKQLPKSGATQAAERRATKNLNAVEATMVALALSADEQAGAQ